MHVLHSAILVLHKRYASGLDFDFNTVIVSELIKGFFSTKSKFVSNPDPLA